MGDAYCSDCKRATKVVFHHSAGDTVCSECGLVLESHSIDETSEWRTFANESRDNDPVRVGGPTNPLLTDGGLSTVISKPNGVTSDFLSSSLGRWQNHSSNHDRSLILAFKTIATMSDRFILLVEYLEKWENDQNAELVLIKGAGRAFSASGDLKMFYDGRNLREFFALTRARLNGKELVAIGLGTHFVPLEESFQLSYSIQYHYVHTI